jgi:hypothetical protein
MNPDPSASVIAPKISALDAAAIKAVRNSLPGKLLGRSAAFLSLVVLVLGFAELASWKMTHMGLLLPGPMWLNYMLLIGVAVLIIAIQLLNEWAAGRNRRKAMELAIKPARVSEEYFRIGPYLNTARDHAAFARADQAHKRVLEWLQQSTSLPLYLTGDSGSGKTSLLNAFVIPALRREGWTVSAVRAGQDADNALRKALTAPDPHDETMHTLIAAAAERCHLGLLIILDQFEEFLILATPEQQRAFTAMIIDLAEWPISKLKLLLTLRSDYQTALDEIGLPRLLQGENFFQVGRFREEAARTFFRNSGLGLKDEPLNRLLQSAAELDDTPGLIRPITLNVLGFVLRQRGGSMAVSVDAGSLVRGYIAQAVENPAIRVWAPPILENMLTEQGTKRPRSERELATNAKLRTGEVRAVLLALAEIALARPLEPTQDIWELSHDFVARAVSRYLGRRRGASLRRAGAYAAPALLVLSVVTGVAAIEWHRLGAPRIRADLADLGILVETHQNDLYAKTTDRFKPDKLTTITPLLKTLSVVNLDLSHTQVTNLEH